MTELRAYVQSLCTESLRYKKSCNSLKRSLKQPKTFTIYIYIYIFVISKLHFMYIIHDSKKKKIKLNIYIYIYYKKYKSKPKNELTPSRNKTVF